MKTDIPDMIDEIYDRIERRFIGDPTDIKEWLSTPTLALAGKSPNDLLKAGRARELLDHVKTWESAEPSTPPAADPIPAA